MIRVSRSAMLLRLGVVMMLLALGLDLHVWSVLQVSLTLGGVIRERVEQGWGRISSGPLQANKQ